MTKTKTHLAKQLTLVTIVLVMTTAMTTSLTAASLYKDIEESDWFYKNVSLLSSYQIINGYSDGTYGPSKTMALDEFIKTVVVAARHYDIQKSTTGYWADPYINKAIEQGYVLDKEFPDYKKAITRGEMSQIIARALPDIGKESFEDKGVWERYEMRISDFKTIPTNQQGSILKVYAKGVLGGYPDGDFKPEKSLSRAEASAVLSRLIVASSRLKVHKISDEDWQAYKKNPVGLQIIDGVEFNPVTDVDSLYGIVNGDIVKQLWEKSFKQLQFYVGEDGLVHVKGYVPSAPKGYFTDYWVEIDTHEFIYFDNGHRSKTFLAQTGVINEIEFKKRIVAGQTFNIGFPMTTDNVHRVFVKYQIVKDGQMSSSTYVSMNYELRTYQMWAYEEGRGKKAEYKLPIVWEEKFPWLK